MKAIFLLALLAIGAVKADDFASDDWGDLEAMSPRPRPTAASSQSITRGPSPSNRPDSWYSELRIPEGYEARRTYYYSYQAQILNGIPELADQYSGYLLQCRVRLVVLPSRNVHMKFDRISFQQTNRIQPRRPSIILPRSQFKWLTNQQDWHVIKRVLSMPVSFVWTKDGQVKQIRAMKKDPFWSSNIKMGVLTMLNVNLRVDSNDVLQGNGVFKRTKQFEDGIDGQCKTSYEYRKFPYDLRNKQNANRKYISISKVRDLTACQAKPVFAHMLFLPENCDQSRRPISAEAETLYRAVDTRNGYFLKDIRTSAQYSYNEGDEKQGSIAAFVVQRLRYTGQKAAAQKLLTEQVSRPLAGGLMMQLPIPEIAKVKRDNAKMLNAATVEAIAMLKNYKQNQLDMYDRMRSMIEIVRRLSKDDVKRLIKRVETSSELQAIENKDILYEVLPKAATKEVVQAFLDLIKARRISDDVGATVISRVSGMSFVSSGRMVKQMMDVALSLKGPKQSNTYKSLILTIGKLINTHYTMPIPQQQDYSRTALTRQVVKQFYSRLLQKSSSVLHKELKDVVVISSLGNCGLKQPCLELIEPYLPPRKDGRPNKRPVRLAAIAALQGVAKMAPRRVRKLALPILFDLREDVELRLQAYEAFIVSRPGLGDLKIITRQMAREPVRQVRSFIATHLRVLSSFAQDRCLAPLALNASRVLREVPEQIVSAKGLQFSRLLGLRLPTSDSIAGVFANIKLPSTGFLPRQVSLEAAMKILGLNINLGGIGLRVDDAQQLLDRLLGPDGSLRTSKSIQELLEQISGKSKINTDFLAAIKLYKSVYGISGISQEATRALKKGLIPVTKDIYRLATKGGQLSRRGEILSFVDQIVKIPTTFGVPFNVNHTFGAHIQLSASVVVRPKLLSKQGTLKVSIKGGASFRHQIYSGLDLTIIRSSVSAMHQVHVPRLTSPSVIKVGWINQRPQSNQILTRVNIQRPQQTKKILDISTRVVTALWSMTRPRQLEDKSLNHRSIQIPTRSRSIQATSEQLGLTLQLQHRILNFTGIQQQLKIPFYKPYDVKVFLKRESNVGGNKGIDISARLLIKRSDLLSSIGDIRSVDEEFQGKDSIVMWDSSPDNKSPELPTPPPTFSSGDDSIFTEGHEQNTKSENDSPAVNDRPYSLTEMNSKQREDFYSEHQRLKTLLSQVVIKLDEMSNNGKPKIVITPRRYISRAQLQVSALRGDKGFSYSIHVQRQVPKSAPKPISTYYASGLVQINEVIRRAMFNEQQPLKIVEDIEAKITMQLRKEQKIIATLVTKLSMGDLWKSNIQRIIRNDNKQLPAIPDIQRCQIDLQRKRFGTPACYQAWKDINALSQVESKLRISPNAPEYLKQYPVLLLNYLRWTQSSALQFSKYVEPQSKVLTVTSDIQLSPYDQRVVSSYLRVLNIRDRYVNARLLINRRNSIAQKPLNGMISNIFDSLYPAKCEVVRRGSKLSWRTFDGVDRQARSKLEYKSGRVVLVQDLKRRFLVSEQKSVNHRVIQIRLRKPRHHVLIVVNEKARLRIPQVFYQGKLRRLPFKLYNAKKQLVLAVVRDPTSRSRLSLTAVMPLLGCSVRTNPLVSTEVQVSPYLHSTVRGICGDFSSEKFDDSKGRMCRAVFPQAQSFLQRYTTILVSPPTLPQLERMRPMMNFMLAKPCPRQRYYPFIR